MKLRFNAGSLRLRLSRAEIAQLKDEGKVENRFDIFCNDKTYLAIKYVTINKLKRLRLKCLLEIRLRTIP